MSSDGIDRNPEKMHDCADKLNAIYENMEESLETMGKVIDRTTSDMDEKMQELATKYDFIRLKIEEQLEEVTQLARKLKKNADDIIEEQRKTIF